MGTKYVLVNQWATLMRCQSNFSRHADATKNNQLICPRIAKIGLVWAALAYQVTMSMAFNNITNLHKKQSS
jgi:hypothetical protein